MGIWSATLFGGDLAEDLKIAIKAVARLPYDPAKIVEVLCQFHRDESSDPNGEEYTTFWLVAADQFHKRGLDSPSLFQRALEIIDAGRDLQIYAILGMSASDLKKRKKVLDGLRSKSTSPRSLLVIPAQAGTQSITVGIQLPIRLDSRLRGDE